jgi:glycosyltransferase involved in cell wall biosynthesis
MADHLALVTDSSPAPRVAVLIPCYDEEKTIAEVVRGFRAALPEAEVYVFDNNSRDRTVEEARAAGAKVYFERRQGKGHVVQAMFSKVEADVYVLVDGDGTYPADAVRALIAPVASGEADMVIGSRLHGEADSEFHLMNRLGNKMYLGLLRYIFGVEITDLLSGYRAFSRRLVRGVSLFGGGFETEAELTIKALERGFVTVEVPVNLRHRPAGSFSKIRIVSDGFRILFTMLALFRDYKPLGFFGGIGIALMVLALAPTAWVLDDFLRSGLVRRLPSAMVAVGMVLTGVISVSVGVILHTVARRFQDVDFHLKTLSEELQRTRPRGPRPLD